MPEEQLQTLNQAQQISPGTLAVIGGIYLVFAILMIVSVWKVYVKAGEPGWAVLIPIYQTIVFFKIAGKPWKWIFWLFFPPVFVIVAIIALVSFVERFGKGGGYIVGLILLPFVFWPMLAFGDAQYLGPKTDGMIGEPALS
jgi:hypothetical protein